MHAALFNRRMNSLRHDLARAGMCRMAFRNHGAPGGKGGGGIPAGGGEGQWKIRRTKDGHRPDGPLQQADFRAGQRCAIGQGDIYPAVKIRAAADVVGHEPQLTGGARAFALQSGRWQTGFAAADVHDRAGACLDLLGDGLQKGGAFGPRGIAIGPKSCFGGSAGGVDMRSCADLKFIAPTARRCVGEGGAAANPRAGDQVFAMRFESQGVNVQGVLLRDRCWLMLRMPTLRRSCTLIF